MKKRELPWYKHAPGEHLIAAAHLSLEQDGALLRMRDWSWLNGPLPANPSAVAKILRAPKKTALFDDLLCRFFMRTDAGWIDFHLEEQREQAIDKRARLSETGARGAAAKWERERMANAKANAMADASEPSIANAIDEPWHKPLYARSKISNLEDSKDLIGSTGERVRPAGVES